MYDCSSTGAWIGVFDLGFNIYDISDNVKMHVYNITCKN